MKLIKLQKLKELPDALHPNNIEEGREVVLGIYGEKIPQPVIGERFTIADFNKWFSTSPVQEIVDNNTFKTLNSIYHWEIIDNEDR